MSIKIAIDAGHGINTPGKRVPDGSMREFQFNSAVATYLVAELIKCTGVECIFTHDPSGIKDVSLKERTDLANNKKVDVLISIHANASGDGWSSAEGIETFVYVNPSALSLKLANAVQKALIAATGLRDRGVKQGNLHMVRESDMPAILVECGFMTNQREAGLLKSDAYRRTCAEAIAKGVVEVYGLKKGETKLNKSEFVDVPDNHWAAASIKKAADKGVLTGVGEGKFDPNGTITRAQLAVILDRCGLLK